MCTKTVICHVWCLINYAICYDCSIPELHLDNAKGISTQQLEALVEELRTLARKKIGEVSFCGPGTLRSQFCFDKTFIGGQDATIVITHTD